MKSPTGYDPDRHFLQLIAAAELLGFSVRIQALGTSRGPGSMDGSWAGIIDPNVMVIFLNPLDHYGDRNATLAHEIGHALQHRDGSYMRYFAQNDAISHFLGEMDAIDRMRFLGCSSEQVEKNRKVNIEEYTQALGLEHMGRS